MSTEQSFLPDIDSDRFEELIARMAAAADRRIKVLCAEARDRAYAEEGLLEWWEAELFGGSHTHEVVERLEHEYRMGTSTSGMITATLREIERLSEQVGNKSLSSILHSVKTPRGVLRYILQLFAYRRIRYQRLNPSLTEVSTLNTLPAARKSAFADYLKQSLRESKDDLLGLVRLEWLSTQNTLAALFVILKERGWLRDYRPYRAIQTAFTKSDTIDKILRPSSLELLQLEDAFQKDLALFKAIKPNPKKN